MACRLSNLFRKLYINSRGVSTSSQQINNPSPVAVSIFQNLTNKNSSLSQEWNLKFSPRIIESELKIQSSPLLSETPRISIIDTPISINRHIIEPLGINYNINNVDDDNGKLNEKSIDLPTYGDVFEKLAVRMIVIRRRKMKKHKRRKLLRRTKVLRQKRRSRQKAKNEKQLKIEVKYLIKRAETYDAKKFVAGKIAKLTQEIIPTRYRGEILPEATIRQFMEADKRRREEKRNRKRLTLD
ncbi:uncharacterized protein LOC122504243 [Leptopilina heterotoma]|uniref:uncharacterized protein LOC122504243 n=1 Tax=Leptopilina heterotoma TaxID=63436 RepID=UPI001CAA1B2F|nr:uncharacterized protein LOC122504243 [Leptopilina heterotoma]